MRDLRQDDAGTKRPATSGRLGRFRRCRRWGIPAVLLVGLVLFHRPLLRGAACGLIAEDAEQASTCVLILDGDRCHAHAARLYHAGLARHILVIEHRPGRLESLGILPTSELVARRELAARAVPEPALLILPGLARDDWDYARCLKAWLNEHPEANVTVLCDRFGSARKRLIFATVLGEDDAGRLRWRALADRDYDETNWWRTKTGVLNLFDGYVSLGHVRLCGEDRSAWREWNPDDYEQSLN